MAVSCPVQERICLGKKVYSPSQVNFKEHLYKKCWPRSLAQANSARACSVCLALTELTRLGVPKCLQRKFGLALSVVLPSEKGYPGTLPAEPAFFSRVNGSSPRFVRKCMKRWLARVSSDRRVVFCQGQFFWVAQLVLVSAVKLLFFLISWSLLVLGIVSF